MYSVDPWSIKLDSVSASYYCPLRTYLHQLLELLLSTIKARVHKVRQCLSLLVSCVSGYTIGSSLFGVSELSFSTSIRLHTSSESKAP